MYKGCYLGLHLQLLSRLVTNSRHLPTLALLTQPRL
jgi:hypothetical protein